MSRPLSILQRPYGAHHSKHLRFFAALAFGAFVFLFLWFFRPFGLEALPASERWRLSAGFGAITTGSMLLLNVVIPLFWRSYFQEERWTTGREIFWTTLNLAVIGLLNAWFFAHWQGQSLNLSFVVWFQGVTSSLGILPISFFVLWKERKYRLRYQRELDQWKTSWAGSRKRLTAQSLHFPSDNKQEELYLQLHQFYFARSADNYIEVHFMEEGQPRSVVLRSSLKKLELHFADRPILFRCHKSYLVNLGQVARLSGNAQGYRLHLKGWPDLSIPVSRKRNQDIKERLDTPTTALS